jgi:hypothetical protein
MAEHDAAMAYMQQSSGVKDQLSDQGKERSAISEQKQSSTDLSWKWDILRPVRAL